MARKSRGRRRAAKAPTRRGRKNWPWVLGIVLIAAAGVTLITISRGSEASAETRPRANLDHWHASLTVNVCGQELPPAPEFETVNGSQVQAGIHSHGDGLIHIHPYSAAEAGDNATVGKFFEFGGWSVSETHLSLWDDTDVRNGDPCEELGGEPGLVRWSLNGVEQSGNPADHKPECDDPCVPENYERIVIAFLPEGEELPAPPEPSQPVDESHSGTDPGPPVGSAPSGDPTATIPSLPDPSAETPPVPGS